MSFFLAKDMPDVMELSNTQVQTLVPAMVEVRVSPWAPEK